MGWGATKVRAMDVSRGGGGGCHCSEGGDISWIKGINGILDLAGYSKFEAC